MLKSRVLLVATICVVAITFTVYTPPLRRGAVKVLNDLSQTTDVVEPEETVCGQRLDDITSLVHSIKYAEESFLYDLESGSIAEHMWWNATVGLNDSLEEPLSREGLESLIRRLRQERRAARGVAFFFVHEQIRKNRNAQDFLFFFSYLCEHGLIYEAEQPLDMAIARAHKSLGDEFTYYKTPELVAYSAEGAMAVSGEVAGPGITLFRKSNSGPFKIIDVRAGGSAHIAGLSAGDRIYAVDGRSVTQKGLEETVSAIRGTFGSIVSLEITRASSERVVVFLTRKVELPKLVTYRRLNTDTFYIRIHSFHTDRSHHELRAALEDISQRRSTPNIVLDLRDNRGGLVEVAVRIVSELADNGVVLYTEDHEGNRSTYTVESIEDRIAVGNVTVIVNRKTASSAEIVAAALKVRGARIVGEDTFGKGVGQYRATLANGGASYVTSFYIFTPTMESFHGVGITPDVHYETLKFNDVYKLARGEAFLSNSEAPHKNKSEKPTLVAAEK